MFKYNSARYAEYVTYAERCLQFWQGRLVENVTIAERVIFSSNKEFSVAHRANLFQYSIVRTIKFACSSKILSSKLSFWVGWKVAKPMFPCSYDLMCDIIQNILLHFIKYISIYNRSQHSN